MFTFTCFKKNQKLTKQLRVGGRMILTMYDEPKEGFGFQKLMVFDKRPKGDDIGEVIHTNVHLPPLTDLQTQLQSKLYHKNMTQRPEMWFTGDYSGCYFDRNFTETRTFCDEIYEESVDEPDENEKRHPTFWWQAPDDEDLTTRQPSARKGIAADKLKSSSSGEEIL